MRLMSVFLLVSLAGAAFAADAPAPDFKSLSPPPPLAANAADADMERQVTFTESADLEQPVTITEKKDVVIEEYRVGGRLYKIKVTPKVGPPYYLIDERGDGQFSRHDGPDASNLSPPQWVIHRF